MACVTNGCSGKCCENFSFAFSLSELDKMIKAIENNEETFIRDDGSVLKVYNDPDIYKIREMLIFNGRSYVDPQLPHATLSERYKYDNFIPDDEPIGVRKDSEKSQMWHRMDNGNIFVNTYTCKHFDKESRICLNYENRPHMCQYFGSNCRYEGCKHTEYLKNI